MDWFNLLWFGSGFVAFILFVLITGFYRVCKRATVEELKNEIDPASITVGELLFFIGLLLGSTFLGFVTALMFIFYACGIFYEKYSDVVIWKRKK